MDVLRRRVLFLGWGLHKSHREPCQMLMSAVYSPHPKSPPLQCLFTSSGHVSARPVAGSSDSSEQQIGAVVQQGDVVTIIWRRAIPYKDSVALFVFLHLICYLRITLCLSLRNIQPQKGREHCTHRCLPEFYMCIRLDWPANDCWAVKCRQSKLAAPVNQRL